MRRRRAHSKGSSHLGLPLGTAKMGGEDLTPGLLSLGVSSDGFSIRLGMLYSTIINRSETPVTIEECLALDLEGVRGLVAEQ
jgi:hypothetical protein